MSKKLSPRLDIIISVIIMLTVVKVFIPVIGTVGWVPSGSMIPTLEIGDRLICISSSITEPDYGDICVFHPNDEEATDNDEVYVKRLIGKPGDLIQVKNGVLYRNYKIIKEDYVANNDVATTASFKVPSGRYLFLGDNRESSFDARFWKDPYIKESQIKYVVKARFYPFNRATIHIK